MECSTKTKILRVLNLVVILSLCFWVKYKNDKAKEMIQWNTKIINSIGVVSFTQSQNSDVLLDIIADREFFPSQLRRGLTKLPINKSAVINNQEWQNFIERLVPQFNN